MYRSVIASVEYPASSWMAFGGAPRIARCEQNVCRSTWDPSGRSPACFEPLPERGLIADW
jgi:hypothetical protein